MTPTTLIIFGVSGDLAGRKILPALYWLLAARKLPEHFAVVGVARREVTPEGLIATVRQHVPGADSEVLERLQDMIRVVRMDSKNPEEYTQLKAVLNEVEQGMEQPIRLFHFSIPPAVALPVIEALKTVGFLHPDQATARLLLEKPFGFDLESAERLEHRLEAAIAGDQLYRLDHYLAKSDVQGLLELHFSDPILAPLWNGQHIERIEIEASEDLDIEGRGDFYEQTGALRDIIQSHLLALTSLALMTAPPAASAAAFCTERARILEAIQPIARHHMHEQAWRGQYQGYREEVGNPNSLVETFAALKLFVDTDRWQGMPIIVSGGKALDARRTEIRIYFKSAVEGRPNPLVIPITSASATQLDRMPDGYERLLLDAMAGDQTNTTSGAEVLASWRLLDPILRVWERSDEGLILYAPGAAGRDIITGHG